MAVNYIYSSIRYYNNNNYSNAYYDLTGHFLHVNELAVYSILLASVLLVFIVQFTVILLIINIIYNIQYWKCSHISHKKPKKCVNMPADL